MIEAEADDVQGLKEAAAVALEAIGCRKVRVIRIDA